MYKYSDKQVIRLSLMTLLFAFLIVYTVLFKVKGDIFKKQTASNTQSMPLITQNNSGKIVIPQNIKTTSSTKTGIEVTKNNNTHINISTGDIVDNINNQSSGTLNKQKTIQTGNNNTTNKLDNQIDIYILSGTVRYNGPIQSIEKLGIDYKYALKDSKDIYYMYLGDENNDFADIVRTLGGNLYVINTEKELIENKLFGDKITYINIPEYKNKIVIMLVDIKGVKRLIQINYAIYHESKKYLQELFKNI